MRMSSYLFVGSKTMINFRVEPKFSLYSSLLYFKVNAQDNSRTIVVFNSETNLHISKRVQANHIKLCRTSKRVQVYVRTYVLYYPYICTHFCITSNTHLHVHKHMY